MGTQLPEGPWEMISIDYFESQVKWYLVVVDYYLRYLNVHDIRNRSSRVTLENIILTNGETFNR